MMEKKDSNLPTLNVSEGKAILRSLGVSHEMELMELLKEGLMKA